MKIKCSYCAAQFDDKEKKCPYCGAVWEEKESAEYNLSSGKNEFNKAMEIIDQEELSDSKLETAFELMKEAAKKKYIDAYYMLAWLFYEEGYGCEQNLNKAFYWYKKSADAGNDLGCYGLGKCYLYGFGVEKDESKGYELLHNVCINEENAPAPALYELGVCYENGYGVRINMIKAMDCYRHAASKGDAEAMYALATIYLSGKEEYGIKADSAEAFNYMQQACDADYSPAYYALGYFYDEGIGCEENPKEAWEWYFKSADSGDIDGEYEAGLCLYYGYGVPENKNTALEIIEDAADKGCERAVKFLEDEKNNSLPLDREENTQRQQIDFDKVSDFAKKGAELGETFVPGAAGRIVGGLLGGLFGALN